MDPIAALVATLRPRTVGAKLITGAGTWGVHYGEVESAGFGLVLEGACWLAPERRAPIQIAKGDFVLMPPNPGFALFSDAGANLVPLTPDSSAGLTELHHGEDGDATFKMLGGYFQCESANADLLARVLPALVHIKRGHIATQRLSDTIDLIADEAMNERPGRDPIVERLVEILLIETLRFGAEQTAAIARPGLLAGLADRHLARSLRAVHADVARHWTVAELAREAGLSRSAFSERFAAKVGVPPMEYVIAWRMALAKDLLRSKNPPLEQVAASIGYESASAFSTAFRRQFGLPPSHFARARTAHIDRQGAPA